MRKRFIYPFVLLLTFLLSMIGCVSPLENGGNSQGQMMDIHFLVKTTDALPSTKALPQTLISGERGKEVASMYLYCFDINGRYVGRYPANIELPGLEGGFSATVPSGTKRIHFIANVNKPIGNDKIGYMEEQLFHGDELGLWGLTDCDRDKIAYWGYIKRDEGEIFATDTEIYLIPDRALLTSGECTDEHITTLEWTVYNGKSNGFIAPYPFDTEYWKDGNTLIPNAPLTPHTNPARDMSTEDIDLDDWAASPSNWKSFPKVYNASTSTGLFVFEDSNELNPSYDPPTKEMPRVIIKATFTDGKVKYFPIRLTEEDGETSLELHRGHSYQLNLDYLPEVMGKATFHEAAKATSFANGQLVDIPSEVAEVSDGNFSLKVVYELGEDKNISTSALFQTRPSDGKVQIPFEFLKYPSGDIPSETDLADWTFSAEWLTKPANTVAETALSVSTVDLANTGKGYVEITLNEINSSLKEGVISLKARYEEKDDDDNVIAHHVLERYIYVYSITTFNLGTPTLEKKTDNGEPYYRLSFSLPSSNAYPAGLYPLKIMMASKTLQPYRTYNVVNNNPTEDVGVVFGVDNRSTGTDVAGINSLGTSGKWDYQSPLWNFWYTYTIYSKKDGDLYYIDFKDIRSNYVGQTISDLGMYLKIEFFGDAKAVSYTPN